MDVGVQHLAREVADRLPGQDLVRAGRRTALAVAGRAAKVVTAGRATLSEAAWVATHAATYPLGLVSERYLSWSPADPLAPLRRRVAPTPARAEHADVPVLLVHGLADNRSVFTVLARELRRCGFRNVYALNRHIPSPATRAPPPSGSPRTSNASASRPDTSACTSSRTASAA